MTAPPDATKDTPGYVPPRPFIVIPPLDTPRGLRGKVVEVRILIGTLGTLDSVEVAGLTDAKYKARYVKMIKGVGTKRDLAPAIYQGCAVPTWWSYSATLDGE